MRILVIGVTLMLATAVVVPRAHSEPGGETIEAALADRVPEGTRIVDVDYKTFANADAGVGRVSVKGTLLATENRYERVGRPKKDHPILRNEITSLGLSKEEYRKYMGLTGYLGYGIKPNIGRYLNLYKIVATADRSRWNFKGDLRYREDLDGFTFGGDLIALSGESLSRRVQGELAKNIAGNSNSDSFIVGCSAYQKLVDKVIN